MKPNPENPRLVFHEEDMNELLDSIKETGIKVPVSVYAEGSKYILLDGERRWRCSRKLNLQAVPAIVQPKPNRLENLLMMFNIHNVRVDWDLMPMAMKLGEVRSLLEKANEDTSPKTLAAVTGVRLPTVKRALELLDLPARYQRMLLKEAEKPRAQQRIKPDLFIEIYKSLHVIERYVPEVFDSVKKPEYIDALVNKYMSGVIDNVVSFRDISKIARAETAGIRKEDAAPSILRLVRDKQYSVHEAYKDTVEAAYEQRTLTRKIESIAGELAKYEGRKNLGEDTITALVRLQAEISRLLR
jgi:ParB/RepB/Spo0J family partition protein